MIKNGHLSTKKEELPLVSIWTLVYNTGPYVLETIKAVINQSYPLHRIQHIIIDDFSTDNSADLVGDWITDNDYKCTYIRHSGNWGICKTLNQVLELVKGKYGMGCSDDLLHPTAIETFVKGFQNLPEKTGMIFCNMQLIDSNGNLISKSYLNQKTINFIQHKEGSFFEKIIKNYFLPAPGTFYKIEALIDIAPYDESLSSEDYDFHLRFAKKYDYIYIDEINVSYRRHDNNKSGSYLSKESLLLMQKCVLKHINEFSEKKSTQDVMGDFMRRNMERAYRFNYNILFRYRMYTDFLLKTNNKLFALKIISKLILKNSKKTIKKIIKKS